MAAGPARPGRPGGAERGRAGRAGPGGAGWGSVVVGDGAEEEVPAHEADGHGQGYPDGPGGDAGPGRARGRLGGRGGAAGRGGLRRQGGRHGRAADGGGLQVEAVAVREQRLAHQHVPDALPRAVVRVRGDAHQVAEELVLVHQLEGRHLHAALEVCGARQDS